MLVIIACPRAFRSFLAENTELDMKTIDVRMRRVEGFSLTHLLRREDSLPFRFRLVNSAGHVSCDQALLSQKKVLIEVSSMKIGRAHV